MANLLKARFKVDFTLNGYFNLKDPYVAIKCVCDTSCPISNETFKPKHSCHVSQ